MLESPLQMMTPAMSLEDYVIFQRYNISGYSINESQGEEAPPDNTEIN